MASKSHIYYLNARCGQNCVETLGFRYDYGLRPVASLGQFPPHRVETVFGPSCGIRHDRFPIQSCAFALSKRFDITLLVLGTSDPAGITARFGFQF
jgi:hypothetical protein